LVSEVGEDCLDVLATIDHEVSALFAGGYDVGLGALVKDELGSFAIDAGVEATGQASVGSDVDYGEVVYVPVSKDGMQVVFFVGLGGQIGEEGVYVIVIGTASQGHLLGTPHFGCGDHGHSLGDLGCIFDATDASL
jgi:hypothetical protein